LNEIIIITPPSPAIAAVISQNAETLLLLIHDAMYSILGPESNYSDTFF
jgi:hypothetical protein